MVRADGQSGRVFVDKRGTTAYLTPLVVLNCGGVSPGSTALVLLPAPAWSRPCRAFDLGGTESRLRPDSRVPLAPADRRSPGGHSASRRRPLRDSTTRW